jgi:hypothetical protein
MTADTADALAPLAGIESALLTVATELRSLNETLRTEADSDALWAILRSGDIRRVAAELRRADGLEPVPVARAEGDGVSLVFNQG